MPYRNDDFAAGQYYHIYNRGVGKAKIFFNNGNYAYLLQLMTQHHQAHGATVIAYCLMPNHYHFLLRQEMDEPLSKLMQVLFNAYVQALNIQQDRTGTLFEGRYRHKCVDNWDYLMILCKDIHLNPVKAKLVNKPEEWLYSNYRDWIGLRDGTLLDRTFTQDHFQKAEEYKEFVNAVDDENKSYQGINKYLFD
jgi:REP element-mobilizing transposase RayT